MRLERNEYRDPGRVVHDVLDRHSMDDGDVVPALVRRPAVDQEVVHTVRLDHRCHDLEQHELSELLAETARAMPIPGGGNGFGRDHAIMTVIAREGLTVFGKGEGHWLQAWFYANAHVDAFTGDVVLMTPYGWVDFMSGMGWHEPRLRAA